MTSSSHCPDRRRVLALGAATLLTTACGRGSDRPAPAPSRSTAPPPLSVAAGTARPSLIFGPGNAFRLDLRTAPVARDSSAMIADLVGQIRPHYDGRVALNTYQFNSSMFVATPSTPRVRVGFDNCQKKPEIPENLYDGKQFFVDVPIPPEARPSKGTDGLMAIWSPHTDQLWEFWVPTRDARSGSWTACWGGRIDGVSRRQRGTFEAPYGAAASGLATVGSMISIAEAQAGRIEHVLQLQLLDILGGVQAYPANRSDGWSKKPHALMMGSRLRLPASVAVGSLDLPPLGKAIARAAQTYGFIVTDSSDAVGVCAESPTAYMATGRPDPWPDVFGPAGEWDQLTGFPWERLEVVEPGYGAPRGTAKVAPHR